MPALRPDRDQVRGAGRPLCDCFPGDDKVYNSLSPRLVRAYAQAWEAPLRPCGLWRGLLAPASFLGLAGASTLPN